MKKTLSVKVMVVGAWTILVAEVLLILRYVIAGAVAGAVDGFEALGTAIRSYTGSTFLIWVFWICFVVLCYRLLPDLKRKANREG